jgi:hypothetical protein
MISKTHRWVCVGFKKNKNTFSKNFEQKFNFSTKNFRGGLFDHLALLYDFSAKGYKKFVIIFEHPVKIIQEIYKQNFYRKSSGT